MSGKRYLAIDLGAESGRAVVGTLHENQLDVEEIHRFPNGPVEVCGTLYWDILGLFNQILHSFEIASQRYGDNISGIGIDSWGVDFGLLDQYGNLLQNPVCHRDSRTEGIFDKVREVISVREVFNHTGIALIPIYTLCQLESLHLRQPAVLDMARTFLMIPDLMNYFLCGKTYCERTNAITTQLYDPRHGQWCQNIFNALDLPLSIMPEIIDPGCVLGELRSQIQKQTGIQQASVLSVCTHDTGSAVAAVPSLSPGCAFISSGTWSVVGMMSKEVITNDLAFTSNVCNELTYQGLFLCRNIMGLWLLQQARLDWDRKGHHLTYGDLVDLAGHAPSGGPLVMVDHASFLHPSDMLEAILAFCRKTQQPVPANEAEVVRCILESLALSYRVALSQLNRLLGEQVQVIHIVGGGSKNKLLCQYTADACQIPVLAGPADATATGNILVQATADGNLASPMDIHEVVRHSTHLLEYLPGLEKYWQERMETYEDMLSRL